MTPRASPHRGGLPWLSDGFMNTIGGADARPVTERVGDYRDRGALPEEGSTARRALHGLRIPFCHSYGCPVKNGSRLERHGLPEELAEGARPAARHLQPSGDHGRVCPPCEAACTLAINLPRSPSATSSSRSWSTGGARSGSGRSRRIFDRQARGRRRVGPAGLPPPSSSRAAATRWWSSRSRTGSGAPAVRHPDFKLEKWVIDRRLDRCGPRGGLRDRRQRGVDVSAAYLRRSFDAIVLAAGPPRGDLPSRERSQGVHFAMEFLTQQNRRNAGDAIPEGEEISAAGKHVWSSRGDTGSDCIAPAAAGAASITQIELLPKPRRTGSRPTRGHVAGHPSGFLFPGGRVRADVERPDEGVPRRQGSGPEDFLRGTGLDRTGRRGKAFVQGDPRLRVRAAGGPRAPRDGIRPRGARPLVRDLGVRRTDGGTSSPTELHDERPRRLRRGDAVIGASLVVRAIDLGAWPRRGGPLPRRALTAKPSALPGNLPL